MTLARAALAAVDQLSDLFNDYLKHRSLVDTLPPLVRKQRRLEAKIAPVAPLVIEEKAVRADIDALLVAAGLQKGEKVTCLGYDVTHNERRGSESTDLVKLEELLVAAGVERDVVKGAIAEATETGDPAKFATVKPCKGAAVRRR